MYGCCSLCESEAVSGYVCGRKHSMGVERLREEELPCGGCMFSLRFEWTILKVGTVVGV